MTDSHIDTSTEQGPPRTDGGSTSSNMVAAGSSLPYSTGTTTRSSQEALNIEHSKGATKDAIRAFVTGTANFQTPDIKNPGSTYEPYDPPGSNGPPTTPGIAQALLRTAMQAQNKELSQQVHVQTIHYPGLCQRRPA